MNVKSEDPAPKKDSPVSPSGDAAIPSTTGSPNRLELGSKIITILISLTALYLSWTAREEAQEIKVQAAKKEIVSKLAEARDKIGINEGFYLDRPEVGDLPKLRLAEESLAAALADLAVYPDTKLQMKAYILQAALHFRRQPRSEAYIILKKAMQIDASDPDANFLEGLFHHVEGQEAEEAGELERRDAEIALAVASYNKALERSGEGDFRTHYNLGLIALDKGWLVSALVHFEKALQLRDYDPDLHFQIGTVYYLKAGTWQELEKSIYASSRAIDYRPNFPSAYYHRGRARLEAIQNHGRISEYEDGKADFLEAIRLYQADASNATRKVAKAALQNEADAREYLDKLEHAYAVYQSKVGS